MEKRGVIDENTPEEKPGNACKDGEPNTKQAADKAADDLTTRLASEVEQKAKPKKK